MTTYRSNLWSQFVSSLSYCQLLCDKHYFTIFAFINSYDIRFCDSIRRTFAPFLALRDRNSRRAHLISRNFLALKLSRPSRLSARYQIFASSYIHIYITRACIIIPASLSRLRIDTFSCRPTGRGTRVSIIVRPNVDSRTTRTARMRSAIIRAPCEREKLRSA